MSVTAAVGDAAAAPRGKCSVAACAAAENGECERGLASPLDCDQFELEPSEESVGAAGAPPTRRLPHGRGLLPAEVGVVLRHMVATRVVPLGTIEAGKTTLFAVMFELLTARRLSRWTYVRSETTLGFAERSHHAAMRSRRAEPTTPRTSGAAGDQVLHITVRRTSDGSTHALLLADVSGEHVEALTKEGRTEVALANAVAEGDVVIILVDGEQAAAKATRQNAIRNAVDIARVLAELPVAENARLAVVLTKGDWFADGSAAEVLAEVAAAVESITGRAPAAFEIAARPKAGAGVEPGRGVEELLDYLVTSRTEEPDHVFEEPTANPSPRTLRRIWGGR